MTRVVTANWYGNEVEVDFEADMERNDYGVPGSPVWYEPLDIEIVNLTILGVDVDINKLPSDLQNEIYKLGDEVEWE